MIRLLWLSCGCVSVVVATIGLFLPVMPTVPFLILAAWSFGRSSPALNQRILRHPLFGPPVVAWQERGAIGRTSKIYAVLAMSAGIGLAIWAAVPVWVIACQAMVCLAAGLYIVTRPNH